MTLSCLVKVVIFTRVRTPTADISGLSSTGNTSGAYTSGVSSADPSYTYTTS